MNTLIGIWRVARGRADGLARFGSSRQAFLSSLAPLIAFPIVGALLVMVGDGVVPALDLLGVMLISQLAPPVLSHLIAARWGREDRWLHYATAYSWCYWAVPLFASALMVVLGVALHGGLGDEAAVLVFYVALGGYSLWLNWFVARHGLDLSRLRAAILVILVNAGTVALALGPQLLSS